MSVLIITMMVVVFVVPVGLVLYYRWAHRERLNFNQIKPKHIEHEVRFYGMSLTVFNYIFLFILLLFSLTGALFGAGFFNSFFWLLLFIPSLWSAVFSLMIFNRWKRFLGFGWSTKRQLDYENGVLINISVSVGFLPLALTGGMNFFELGKVPQSTIYFSIIPLLAAMVIMSIVETRFALNFRKLVNIKRADDGDYQLEIS